MANNVHEEDVSSHEVGSHRRVLGGQGASHWRSWKHGGGYGVSRIGL